MTLPNFQDQNLLADGTVGQPAQAAKTQSQYFADIGPFGTLVTLQYTTYKKVVSMVELLKDEKQAEAAKRIIAAQDARIAKKFEIEQQAQRASEQAKNTESSIDHKVETAVQKQVAELKQMISILQAQLSSMMHRQINGNGSLSRTTDSSDSSKMTYNSISANFSPDDQPPTKYATIYNERDIAAEKDSFEAGPLNPSVTFRKDDDLTKFNDLGFSTPK